MAIETVFGENTDESALLLEAKINRFLKKYPKSSHIGRIRYLLGVVYIRNKKEDKGRNVFDSLLQDEQVSEYIKGLVRSELSLLRIKETVM